MSCLDEDKPLQFLYEYAVRWSAYSNSLWKLSNVLSKFESELNTCYEESWPHETNQFRIYKMMAKIWNSEVNNEEMMLNLKDSFKCALKTYHQDLLQHIRDKSVRKETLGMEAVLK